MLAYGLQHPSILHPEYVPGTLVCGQERFSECRWAKLRAAALLRAAAPRQARQVYGVVLSDVLRTAGNRGKRFRRAAAQRSHGAEADEAAIALAALDGVSRLSASCSTMGPMG